MIRLSRLILQWAVFPPIHIHVQLPQPRPIHRSWPPPPKPKPAGFDPAKRVSNYQARCLAASNALTERN